MNGRLLAAAAFMLAASISPVSLSADEQHSSTDQPMFLSLNDAKWDKILPALGEASPEISILHVGPKTQATQLLIRTSTGIHVRKHWHTANETHMMIIGTATFECDGKRAEIGPGGFNYMPARMVHEAWLPASRLLKNAP